jgi:hypothetical protein
MLQRLPTGTAHPLTTTMLVEWLARALKFLEDNFQGTAEELTLEKALHVSIVEQFGQTNKLPNDCIGYIR